MNQADFNHVRDMLNDHCSELLGTKKLEYCGNEKEPDRLEQFKTSAILRRTNILDACGGKMVKHATKLFLMIDKSRTGAVGKEADWREVIGDLRNYCDLLYACLMEELNKREEKLGEELSNGRTKMEQVGQAGHDSMRKVGGVVNVPESSNRGRITARE